jgi:hypothetical protein
MNLKDFFDSERKRVHTPGPFFTSRLIARLSTARPLENGIWEMIPGSARPVLALALVVILSFVLVEIFVPTIPQIGLIEESFESVQTPGESLFYGEEDVPAGDELLEQLIALEEVQ